jgi:3-deoxy-7-phosphoheptulonate synthase
LKHAAKLVLKQHEDDRHVVQLAHGVSLGDGRFAVIAGPCAVESQRQLETIADGIKKSGAHGLRGGAFKPRTSPYSFQGLGEEALKMLHHQSQTLRMPVVSEVMDASQIDVMQNTVDAFQVGARNMQNFSLLKALSKTNKPIFLKRGFAATLEEWLLAAEYILEGGNNNVVLVERGIRTFDNTLRNTLDLAGMVWVKQRTKLPVFVDPSHSTGQRDLVIPMSLAAAAAGADGIIVEVHHAPHEALSDGPQALTLPMFSQLMKSLGSMLTALDKQFVSSSPTLSLKAGGIK